MTWHTGRTVGVTLYQGDGPSDMVGVMVGPHDEACDLAVLVVEAVNAHAALTARLAEAEADAEEARTVTRQADAAARDYAAQVVRWRALVGEFRKYAWHWPMCASDDGCTCGYRALDDQAQAALDGAPGAG